MTLSNTISSLRAAPLFLCLLALFTLFACQREPLSETTAQLFVFGTLVDVAVVDSDPARARNAIADIETEFQRMHRDLHAWVPGELVRVNQAFKQREPVETSEEITALVKLSQRAETASKACFNPAIGALVGLWGFHTSDYPILGPPPSDTEIDHLLAQKPSMQDILVEGLTLESANAAVQLDFGGIAKGHAIDQALNILASRGINNAMVNAGGDLRTLGKKGDRPWRIAIRHPAGGLVGVLEPADDEAVFTSGVYERYRQDAAERYPHIIDPRTGQPVAELASVTVVAKEGAWADAAATALTVAGPGEWISIARSMGIQQVLMVASDGSIRVSEALHRRLEYDQGLEQKVELVAMESPARED